MEVNTDYALDDRYRVGIDRVYLTGTQALVRLPIEQQRRDSTFGMRTAGFISGYPGSPLGGYDHALHEASALLRDHHVTFQPAVNEDLAATSIWGSQQVPLLGQARYDGVFAIWYGKGPGVDRSIDAIKHGAYAGASARGGVLVLAGDDHGARSSTIAHQSDHAFVHSGMPTLHPATVQEYLDYGLWGFALSRFSGCWVGFKCVTDTVESSASVSLHPDRLDIVSPDLDVPPEARQIRWGVPPLVAEERLWTQRLPAAQAFVQANRLDRVVLDSPRRRLGIVTTGKAYLDVRAALEELGLHDRRCAELGVSVFKVAMPWPLEPTAVLAFADGHEEVLVVEEKRPLVEEQLARLLVNRDRRPKLVGKTDEVGARLVPNEGELSPSSVRRVIGARLLRFVEDPAIEALVNPRPTLTVRSEPAGLTRLPAFCSGCPHNTSTKLPEGSVAFGGIGCHGMAVWMPERPTLSVSQMGGEGAAWIGMAPFTDRQHVFQNLGDGTYFHSGLLAIRAAVASGANITYKILANGAIAMTGGQDIQGDVPPPDIARQLAAEGVRRIAIVSDEPVKWRRGQLPAGATLHHRSELDGVQRELRDVPGTTVIVYEQACAAEKRRKRKRGQVPDPDTRVVINELVCEGCGDCSVASNCISVEPIETEFGRKRRINQSSCNKDYTCVQGYCPSFVTLSGATPRKAQPPPTRAAEAPVVASLPRPVPADASPTYSILVAGIGGTGIVTVGALLGMAGHLEGKGVTVLDVAGLAQKNGPVTSHVRISDDAAGEHVMRIPAGGADLVIGADVVVTSGDEGIARVAPGRTRMVVNSHVAPTSDFARNPDLDLSSERMIGSLRRAAGDSGIDVVAATALATALTGDAVFTNAFLLGFALQRGYLPVSLEALDRAIELNGVAVEANRQALAWGRLAAHDPAAVERAAAPVLGSAELAPEQGRSLQDVVARRVAFLTDYQDAAYGERYRRFVERVADVERERVGGRTDLAEAVARHYFKLLAVKDEYEVARLLTSTSFRESLHRQFEGNFRVEFHLAPQLLNRRDKATGRARKMTFGPWMGRPLRLLARARRVRGTKLDVLNRTEHRRRERALIGEYEGVVDEVLSGLNPKNHALAIEVASIPEHIRGYDTIKEEHMGVAKAQQAELLSAFRSSAGTSAVTGARPGAPAP